MSRFARSYAQAFLAAAPPEYDVQGFLEKASAIERAVSRDPRMKAFFRALAIPAEPKRRALEDLSARAGCDDFGRRFLKVILDNRRMADLSVILAALRSAHDAKRGVLAADVTVASPISEAEKEKIEAALSREVGKSVRAKFVVDSGILAGFVAKVGSEILDASTSRAIERFAEEVKEGAKRQGFGDRNVPGES